MHSSKPNSERSPEATPAPLPIEDAREQHLVAAAQKGDQSVWPELIRMYQSRMFGLCLKMVHNRDMAADLTQDAFLKIIKGLDTYDGRSKFSTWAYRITMNVCLSKLRSEKLRRHASLDAPGKDVDGAAGAASWGASMIQERELSPGSGVERQDERRLLSAGLQTLDPEQRAILILRDGRDLDYEQIAETLGIAVGTVKSRLFRARVALREAIEAMQKHGIGEVDADGES
ncbi:MAG: RNA polymerase sigma factor [Phycisphaerales bacterium]